MAYLIMNNSLHQGQYGFRKDHSTFIAVMETSEARDNGRSSV